jgi:hypothetical protein
MVCGILLSSLMLYTSQRVAITADDGSSFSVTLDSGELLSGGVFDSSSRTGYVVVSKASNFDRQLIVLRNGHNYQTRLPSRKYVSYPFFKEGRLVIVASDISSSEPGASKVGWLTDTYEIVAEPAKESISLVSLLKDSLSLPDYSRSLGVKTDQLMWRLYERSPHYGDILLHDEAAKTYVESLPLVKPHSTWNLVHVMSPDATLIAYIEMVRTGIVRTVGEHWTNDIRPKVPQALEDGVWYPLSGHYDDGKFLFSTVVIESDTRNRYRVLSLSQIKGKWNLDTFQEDSLMLDPIRRF